MTSQLGGYRPALPHDDRRHLAAQHFLAEEAAMLDAQCWDEWLGVLHPEIRYVMPVRVTTSIGTGYDALDDMAHFDEDLYSLRKRVERLQTEHAWTEDPPSRTRHVVTNVRTFADGEGDDIRVESSLVLLRSRGDTRPLEVVSATRHDTLTQTPEGWRLRARRIMVDESVLRTQNLAIFL